jgi:hypothetical protein
MFMEGATFALKAAGFLVGALVGLLGLFLVGAFLVICIRALLED